MKKILYVNGCSHSCGAEISYPKSHRTNEDLSNSWAGQLASKYNMIHVNHAIGGQGNDGIFSNTVQSVLNLLDTHHPKEILVIIGWSSFERTEYVYDNKLYRFVPGCQELPLFKKWPLPVRNAFENWILSVDYHSNMNKFSLIYFNMINFLKQYQLDYYFFNAIQQVIKPKYNLLHELHQNKPCEKLFNLIELDKNYLEPYQPKMTYYNYMRSRYDGHIDGRNHHFLANAQSDWANVLDQKIQHLL